MRVIASLTLLSALSLLLPLIAKAADSQGCGGEANFSPPFDNIAAACHKSARINEEASSQLNSFNSYFGYEAYSPSQSDKLEDRLKGIDLQLRQAATNDPFRREIVLKKWADSPLLKTDRALFWNTALADTAESKPKSESELLELLARHSIAPPGFSDSLKRDFIGFIDHHYQMNEQLGNLRLLGPQICLTRGCGKAFRKAVTLVSPGSIPDDPSSLSFPSILKEAGTSPLYDQLISAIAIKLKAKVDAAVHGHLADEGDLYDDVMTESRRIGLRNGLDPVRSEEMGWNVLALYASRGTAARPFYRLANSDNFASMVGLGLIASSVSFLDKFNTSGEDAYSLPRGFISSCEYSRPYHFWMAAFLAHKLLALGFSAPDILEALHRLEVEYETFAQVATKTSLDIAVGATTPMYPFNRDSYRLETQKNIAFHDAGAAFGLGIQANSGTTSSFIDLSLRKMLESSSRFKDFRAHGLLKVVEESAALLTGQENMRYVFDWNAQLAPDAGFNGTLDSLRHGRNPHP